MSPKRWLALLAFYISYLFFGASIYYHIENALEKEKRSEALEERIEINEYLVYQFQDKDNRTQTEILEKITNYCGKSVTNYTSDKYEDPYRWTFYHSLFFAYTVCSTVGYGNLAPSTTLGQMILIVYSLIGVPINGILFAGLGDYFARFFTNIYQRYKEYKMSNDDLYVPRQFGLFATITIALIPGITFFIIIPSCMFSYFEGWPFTLSLYYSYVTTTTIGFGDYVPTFQPHQEREFGILFIFYQIFIIIWFIFALGYLLMIMTFITKGLRCKKLAQLEKQLSYNIKATQSRIWHGVTKDVGYLRRILNELVINVKPVYNEPGEKNDIEQLPPRSASCPDLEMYRVTSPIVSRKRAFSESFDQLMNNKNRLQLATGTPLIRVSSDTNLNKINKNKTFGAVNAFKETTSLLARVVTALAKIEAPPPQTQPFDDDDTNSINSILYGGGYNNLTDSQILSSELSFPYNIENKTTTILPPYRNRACSECFLNRTKATLMTTSPTYNEWTWGGDNNQIQQIINNRARLKKSTKQQQQQEPFYKTSNINNLQKFNDFTIQMNGDNQNNGKSRVRKFSEDSKSFFKRFIPFKKRNPQQNDEFGTPATTTATAAATNSGFDLQQYQMKTRKLRKHSTISVPDETITGGTQTTQQQYPQIDSLYSTISGSQATVIKKTDRKSSLLPPQINNYFTNLFTNNSSSNTPTPTATATSKEQRKNSDSITNSNYNITDLVQQPKRKRFQSYNESKTSFNNIKTNFNNENILQNRRSSLYNNSNHNYERRSNNFIKNSEFRNSMRNPSLKFEPNNQFFTRNTEQRNSIIISSLDRHHSNLINNQQQLNRSTNSFRSSSIDQQSNSLYSVPSEEELEMDKTVLENTSIADLIRALERLHTNSSSLILPSQLEENSQPKELPKKQRKIATVIPPKFPQIFTIFSQNNEQQPPNASSTTSAAVNSGRRSTIFGSLTTQQSQPQQLLNRKTLQRSLTRPNIQLLPSSASSSLSFSSNSNNNPDDNNTQKESMNKFRRRFSVRPTELQIPLGKAPPVISAIPQFSSQTALQRRLSLRPSPLARELAKQTASSSSSASMSTSVSSITSTSGGGLSSGIGRGSTSSTHSPLSRMAQIQSSRKNSKPDLALSPLGLESSNTTTSNNNKD